MPIKILFLLSSYGAGGAERQYFNLIHGIDKHEFDVHIGLIRYRQNRPSPALLESLADVRVRMFDRNYRADISVVFDISRYARENKIDIIQSLLFMDNQIGRVAGLISGKSVITSIRGEPLPLLGKWNTWLEFRMQRLSKKIVVNSDWLKSALVRQGSESEKVVVIHNGTAARNFQCEVDQETLRHKYRVPGHAVVMGIVARLHPVKDHVTFFDAVKMVRATHPSVHAVIAGDGEMRTRLQAYVKEIGIDDCVTFLGTVTNELPEVYRIMDIFILTSLSESFPNVVLEAMSAGVPVVATNISDVPSIISDGKNGYIVETRNPALVADRVVSLLSNSPLRDLFIKNGLARTEQFAVPAMVNKFQQLYTDVYRSEAQVSSS